MMKREENKREPYSPDIIHVGLLILAAVVFLSLMPS